MRHWSMSEERRSADWKRGLYNPSLKMAMDIAKVFDMPVEKLFEFYEDE